MLYTYIHDNVEVEQKAGQRRDTTFGGTDCSTASVLVHLPLALGRLTYQQSAVNMERGLLG